MIFAAMRRWRLRMSWHFEGSKNGQCASIREAACLPSDETVSATKWTSQYGRRNHVKCRENSLSALAYRPWKYARRETIWSCLKVTMRYATYRPTLQRWDNWILELVALS